MNGLTAAKGLRRSVDQAGGLMRISVGALGDAFGRGRMTVRARTGIEQVLQRAGIEVVPRLTEAGDGWVTLRATTTVPPQMPPRPGNGPAVLSAVREEVRALPRPHIPASLATALALLVPVAVASAVVGSGDDDHPAAPARTVQEGSLLDRAETAMLAGDYKVALTLTKVADPAAVPELRRQISGALLNQARTAQQRRAYVRAIRLSRRAARFGRAPGAAQIIRQSRAGLDLRREAQRRAARVPAGRR